MASTLTRTQKVDEGVITVEILLSAKDATDDTLVRKFGDIIVNPSGTFSDPNDLAYPKFIVQAGEPIEFFDIQVVRAIFSDMSLTFADRARRAKLWGDAVQLQIQNQLTALRLLTDNVTQSTSIPV